MGSPIYIIARQPTVQAAWRKVLAVLLGRVPEDLVTVPSVADLPPATQTPPAPLAVLFGTRCDAEEQFAAWETWRAMTRLRVGFVGIPFGSQSKCSRLPGRQHAPIYCHSNSLRRRQKTKG